MKYQTIKLVVLLLMTNGTVITINYFNLKRISGCSFSGGFYGFSFMDSLLYTWGIEYEIVPFICILSIISIIVLFSVVEYITVNIIHKMKKINLFIML